jgi:hypothetical protein
MYAPSYAEFDMDWEVHTGALRGGVEVIWQTRERGKRPKLILTLSSRQDGVVPVETLKGE